MPKPKNRLPEPAALPTYYQQGIALPKTPATTTNAPASHYEPTRPRQARNELAGAVSQRYSACVLVLSAAASFIAAKLSLPQHPLGLAR